MSNPLEALKQKMIIKPQVEERQRVAIIIKGDKPQKRKATKAIENIDSNSDSETEKVIEQKPISEQIGEIKEDKMKPIIIDKTQQGYDRETLLKKLKESKLTKVIVKPQVDILEEKKPVKCVEPFE
jgi:hypothetical protein